MATRWPWSAAILAAVAAALPMTAASAESACPRAGTLGVSRTVEIDTTGGPGFGMQHYKAYDFLQPKEVVLTFDDGPQMYTTDAVLKALADECVKATFFSIGKMALGMPEIIREVSNAGHTVGTHTWSHKAIAKLKTFDEGKDEIERGISAVHRAVGQPIAPFFRFPTLVDSPDAIAYLGKRNIAMFSTDIDSFDFKPQTADHLVKSLIDKLDKRGKGIILMHDIHKTTAKALPAILAQLKAKGYKIVHLTPKAPVTTLAEYDSAIEKEAKGLPQVGAERPVSSIVKTIGGAEPAAEAPAAPSGSAEPAGMPEAPAAPPPAPPPPPANTIPGSVTQQPGVKSQSSIGTEGFGADADIAASPPPSSPMLTKSAAATPVTSPISAASPVTTAAPVTQAANNPVATVPAPSAQPPAATTPPATTASVVRTISGEKAAEEKMQAAEPAPVQAANEAPPAPSKTLTQRAKETWELWFGR